MKSQKTIRPDLLGSEIKVKNYPSLILLNGSPECIDLCETLKLDVFATPSVPKHADVFESK